MEALLKNILNNDFSRTAYLDKNAGNIEVQFLGDSHAYFDIDTALIHTNNSNAAYVSQSLCYDYRILCQFPDKPAGVGRLFR